MATVPAAPAWIDHPVVQAVLHQLLDMLERIPLSERKRSPGFRLTKKELPAFFALESHSEMAFSWGLLQDLERMGWLRIQSGKTQLGVAGYEASPRIVLIDEAEPSIRTALGREGGPTSYAREWRDALSACHEQFHGDTALLMRQPIWVEGKTAEQVVARLLLLAEIPDGTYFRQVSARLFWGLSKKLENRPDAINALLGVERSGFIEKPILINASIRGGFEQGILFIENETTYHAMVRGNLQTLASGYALVWSSGFMSSAKRLRLPAGTTLHFDRSTTSQIASRLEDFWFSIRTDVPVYFFGDLDYSGLQILKQLREVFPGTQAWQPGYDQLLAKLHQGFGHTPESAEKAGQVHPGLTGCAYADTVLLPALQHGPLFVDQEIVLE